MRTQPLPGISKEIDKHKKEVAEQGLSGSSPLQQVPPMPMPAMPPPPQPPPPIVQKVKPPSFSERMEKTAGMPTDYRRLM